MKIRKKRCIEFRLGSAFVCKYILIFLHACAHTGNRKEHWWKWIGVYLCLLFAAAWVESRDLENLNVEKNMRAEAATTHSLCAWWEFQYDSTNWLDIIRFISSTVWRELNEMSNGQRRKRRSVTRIRWRRARAWPPFSCFAACAKFIYVIHLCLRSAEI